MPEHRHIIACGALALVGTVLQIAAACDEPRHETATDIVPVLPAPPASAPPRGRLVPSPTASATSNATAAALPSVPATAASGAVTAAGSVPAALADLALAVLREHSHASGPAQTNEVLSPVGIATALGMLHAGTRGKAAQELAAVLDAGLGGQAGSVFDTEYPQLLARLNQTAAGAGQPPYVMASRVWVDQASAAPITPAFMEKAAGRFGADGMRLPFSDARAARQTINAWTLEKTGRRIPELLPEGAVTPATRLVLTNALHFKNRWAQPFDPEHTTKQVFHTLGGDKPVAMMHGVMPVRSGVVDNVTVHELPFENRDYALVIGLPPPDHTLNAFETVLNGADMARWSAELRRVTCDVQLPRFSLSPSARSLKPALRALGVQAAFGPEADFTPMLGQLGRRMMLEDVFHSAAIVIDEDGGEAAAATAAVLKPKSIAFSSASCIVDRPFIFALLHRPTGLPLFVGKVADPSLP